MIRNITLGLALFIGTCAMAVTVTVSVSNATCGACNGYATAVVNGGLPPYTFAWSPAPSSGQGTPSIQGLCEGTWTVVVTDGLGGTAQADAVVLTNTTLGAVELLPLRSACDGACSAWGFIPVASLGGTAPFTYDFPSPQVMNNVAGNGTVAFAGVCPGVNTIAVTDANGCTGTIEGWIMDGISAPPLVLSTTPACGGEANGAIIMSGAGAFGYAAFMVYVDYEEVIYSFNSDGPYTLGGLAPGTYDVYTWSEFGSGLPGLEQPGVMYCTSAAQATVGSVPQPCGGISGRVYHDADQDCSFNGFDLAQPYRVLTIEPGNQFTITDGAGNYQRNLDFGSYTVTQGTTANEDPLCPAPGSADLTLDATTPIVTQDFANLSTVPHDLSVSITSSAARPGFPTRVYIHVTNNSAFPSGAVSLVISYDNILLNPSAATWNIPVLAPYASQQFQFNAAVPADIALLGANLNYGVTVTNSLTELNTANNTAFIDVTITGSYDPNDKRGLTSSRTSADQYFLDQDEHLDYTVRFQNTGTDTAFTVVIRDVLDTDLDITSLKILGASHDFVPSFGGGRELVFTFNDIGLPDSTTDLLGSQGYISYRIKPMEDLAIGDVIENTAGIFFDFNPPIITNTTSHAVDFTTALNNVPDPIRGIILSPNPAADRVRITGVYSSIDVIRIHAADGRLIRTLSPTESTFDVADLEPGCYLVHVVTKDGQSFVSRFTRA